MTGNRRLVLSAVLALRPSRARLWRRFALIAAAVGLGASALSAGVLAASAPPAGAAGGFFAVSAPSRVTTGIAFKFTVSAPSNYRGTVKFGSTYANASLPAPYTFTEADAGTHTFSAILNTSGNNRINVENTRGTDFGSSNLINVGAPGVFTHFAVSAPSAAIPGRVFAFTVTALDNSNNVVTGFRGGISIGSGTLRCYGGACAPRAELPSGYGFTAVDAGTHVFFATFNAQGDQTIQVVDTAPPQVYSTSNSIIVSYPATHFAVSAPRMVRPAADFSFSVTALNHSDGTAFGYRGTVVFFGATVTPNPYTFTAADAGTHRFFGTLNPPGGTITVLDGPDRILGTSNRIDVDYYHQAVTFTSRAPSDATVGGPTYQVTATGGVGGLGLNTSGNPVTFSIDPSASSVCSLAPPDTVSFIGAGTCVIDANQAGNAIYLAAPQSQQSFNVVKAAQAITFTSSAPSDATVRGPTYHVTATGGASTNPVTFSIDPSASSVCSITAPDTVSYTARGTCVIDANQAGDANYSAAPQALQSFAVHRHRHDRD